MTESVSEQPDTEKDEPVTTTVEPETDASLTEISQMSTSINTLDTASTAITVSTMRPTSASQAGSVNKCIFLLFCYYFYSLKFCLSFLEKNSKEISYA